MAARAKILRMAVGELKDSGLPRLLRKTSGIPDDALVSSPVAAKQ